ncbi:4-hydroxy-2-oxoheptanedioate aldolase [Noviherbaspirillum aridicola]|uniref:2,4-dihydroxyhept-2-ene-1,7-dioic acid aldolase n=1 Tax=Noviherbaspirillum aridicola TaxID=2849687 RepID=A0ABQ4Q665_9BURK|nr:4-hydroxy-2-oxoheptanedioate aldolase [Noviherbaspirillum aridicola]GIZ52295.1 2,4-dihydroxyhept-2-ene-1,7-dioic acid aldolase [Noviherbaspirillum aridicola]
MENRFKAALRSGRPQVGYWLSLANPYSAEICATAGFDWLLLDGEHGPNDVRSLLAQLQALAGHASQPVVRPVSGDAALLKQLLDIGAQSLLVPMVDTAEQAAQLVRAVRYPPEGVRGVAAFIARASQWGLEADYMERANREICLLIQAETRSAIENLDALCGVDGVDGIFIGPSDLAASLGHPGNAGHPEVQAAIDDGLRRIIASGKAAGILSTDPKQARRYMDMGCHFVAVGIDVATLASGARSLRAAFGGGAAQPAGSGY